MILNWMSGMPILRLPLLPEILLRQEKHRKSTLHFRVWQDTNTAYLEVSGIPPIDAERRLQYLINYPHGCIEQITSTVFAQLYLAGYNGTG